MVYTVKLIESLIILWYCEYITTQFAASSNLTEAPYTMFSTDDDDDDKMMKIHLFRRGWIKSRRLCSFLILSTLFRPGSESSREQRAESSRHYICGAYVCARVVYSRYTIYGIWCVRAVKYLGPALVSSLVLLLYSFYLFLFCFDDRGTTTKEHITLKYDFTEMCKFNIHGTI